MRTYFNRPASVRIESFLRYAVHTFIYNSKTGRLELLSKCKTGPTFYSILNIQLRKCTVVEQITSRLMNIFEQQLSVVGAAPPTSLHSIKRRII